MKIPLKVTIQELGKEVEFEVRETSPVVLVISKATEAAGITLKENHALFEIMESLKLRMLVHNIPITSYLI